MTLLNTAADVKLGTQQVDRIYLGTDKVWERAIGYHALAMSTQPVGFWPLDDFQRTASPTYARELTADVRSNDWANITNAAGPFIATQPSAYFNGSTSGMTIPGVARLNVTNQVSVSAWVYRNSATQNGFIFEKTTNGNVNTQYAIFFEVDRICWRTVRTDGTIHSLYAPVDAMLMGQWSHLAATWDGATKRVYVNGALIASVAYTEAALAVPATTSAGTSFIGCYGTGGYRYHGRIANVAVYNKALTHAQVRAQAVYGGDMTYPASVLTDGPVAYYRFAGNGLDSTGNGRDITLGTSDLNFAITSPTGRGLAVTGAGAESSAAHHTDLARTVYSVEFWVRPGLYTGGWRMIWCKGNGEMEQRGPGIWLHPSTTNLHFQHQDTGVNTQQGIDGPPLSMSDWTHVVAVQDTTGPRILYNGNVVAANTRAVPLETNTFPVRMFVGAFGQIADFAYYPFAMSQARAAAHFAAGAAT